MLRLPLLRAVIAGLVVTTGVRLSAAVTPQHTFFPAHIDAANFQLEAMIYRPDDAGRHPLVIFSHGRNGMFPSRNPGEVNGYPQLCQALAAEGCAVVFFVRRGYGNSDGPDVELQDTAVLSGLEAAKDYQAAVDYWRTAEFVLPDRVVLMGQSQGGWSVLACTNVPMDGVLGAVNISGGTNYRLMGTGAVTAAVQDHWVAGCGALGAADLVPSFWIYAENDQSINGPTARRMFNAFAGAGGWAYLLMLPAYGTNGHAIVERPDLFLPQLNDFFATIGFRDEAGAAPVIASVNGPASVTPGTTVVFTVNATGNPMPAFQWRKNGVNLANGGNVAGATSAALTISNAQSSDPGTYTVVATNELGSATSTAVNLAVVAPAPVTPAASRSGGGGGAISGACIAALLLLGLARRAGGGRRSQICVTRDARDSPGGFGPCSGRAGDFHSGHAPADHPD